MRLPTTNQWITAAVSTVFLWAISRALATEGLLDLHRELFETARWLVIAGAALLCLMPRR